MPTLVLRSGGTTPTSLATTILSLSKTCFLLVYFVGFFFCCCFLFSVFCFLFSVCCACLLVCLFACLLVCLFAVFLFARLLVCLLVCPCYLFLFISPPCLCPRGRPLSSYPPDPSRVGCLVLWATPITLYEEVGWVGNH